MPGSSQSYLSAKTKNKQFVQNNNVSYYNFEDDFKKVEDNITEVLDLIMRRVKDKTTTYATINQATQELNNMKTKLT
jgi:hypothetical protein